MEKLKNIVFAFCLLCVYSSNAQILLSGKLIHELPLKNSVDTGDLLIVANPSTGKPYKVRKNQIVAGANGVTDGDKGDIVVTGLGGVFTIDGSSVQNGKLATMGDNTFKGNLSGTTASPQDLTSGQVISALGINLKMAYSDTAYLSTRIDSKQNTLVSGSNIKTINGNNITGSGDIAISGSVSWGNVTGSNIMLQTDLRDSFEHTIAAGTTGQYWRGDKTWQTLNKAAVGLSAVDNTSDADKPISNATNASLSGKQAQLVSGTNIKTINFIDLLGSGNITISGGGGGGETLDQTLALGNTTDTSIVFDKTMDTVGPSGSQTKEWLRFEPLIKGSNASEYDVDFAFRQASVNFSFAEPLNKSFDEIMLFGWNLAAGGSLEESSVVAYANLAAFPGTGNYNTIYKANNTGFHYNWNGSAYVLGNKRGRTAIGESWENRYNAYDNDDMYTEKHEVYVDPLGTQSRLSSYTINTSTNYINYYKTVSDFALFKPGSSGLPRVENQYFTVTPGALSISTDSGQVRTGIQSQYQVSYGGGTKNLTLFTADGMEYLVFSGYTNIDFTSDTLRNAVLASTVILPQDVTFSVGTTVGSSKIYDNTDAAKYINTFVSASNLAMDTYAYGGVNRIWTHGFTEIKNYGVTNLYWNEQFRFYSNGTFGYLMSNNDLEMNLGYASNVRYDNAWVKQGHINELDYFSKAGNPTTTDVPAGKWMTWKNTTTGDTYIYMNDGGTMKRIGPLVTF